MSFLDATERAMEGIRLARCLQAISSQAGSVLEAGCGGGHFIRSVKRARPDPRACGCDVSWTAIQRAYHLPPWDERACDLQKRVGDPSRECIHSCW